MKILVLALFITMTQVLFAAKAALIVGNKDTASAKSLIQALNKLKYEVDLVELDQSKPFPTDRVYAHLKDVSIRLIEGKDAKTWMNEEEADFWTEYLSAKGSMIMFADRLGAPEIYASSFLRYTGVELKRVNLKAGRLVGQPMDLISDSLNFAVQPLTEGDIHSSDKGSADVVLSYEDGAIAAIKEQSCAFRLTYLTVLPDWMEQKNLNKLLDKTLDWNLGFALGVGYKAPDFPALDLEGNTTGFFNHLSQADDRITVIEFFATWCSSCAQQLPVMVELKKSLSNQPVDFYYISYMEKIPVVQEYLKKHPELNWPVLITQNGAAAQKYGVKNLPSIFILDNKKIVRHIHKSVTDLNTLQKEVEESLKSLRFERLYR